LKRTVMVASSNNSASEKMRGTPRISQQLDQDQRLHRVAYGFAACAKFSGYHLRIERAVRAVAPSC
jgi:hypothetical protein